jgi:hypothetical protein
MIPLAVQAVAAAGDTKAPRRSISTTCNSSVDCCPNMRWVSRSRAPTRNGPRVSISTAVTLPKTTSQWGSVGRRGFERLRRTRGDSLHNLNLHDVLQSKQMTALRYPA